MGEGSDRGSDQVQGSTIVQDDNQGLPGQWSTKNGTNIVIAYEPEGKLGSRLVTPKVKKNMLPESWFKYCPQTLTHIVAGFLFTPIRTSWDSIAFYCS